MSENNFNSQELNLQIQPLPVYIDSDGAFKLNTPMLSSFDFDGLIPKFDGNINAIDVKPGYMIQAVSGEYFPVISVEYDEDDMEDVPSGIVTINYLNDQGNIVSVDYDELDPVAVVYEDWNEKSLGTQGWGITAGGNAIFTNVAVRGRIEAEEGYISGNLTIGSGGSTTLDDVATADDLTDFITGPEVNTNVTSISGGVITSGRIKSGGYNGPVSGGGSFSTVGSQFNLDDGTIVAPNFRIDKDGFSFFKGQVTSTGLIIEGGNSTIEYTRNISGTQSPQTDFYSILSLDGKDIFLKAATGDPAKIRWIDSSSRQRATIGWEVSDDEGGEGTSNPNTLVVRSNSIDTSPADTPGQILIHAQGEGSSINLKTGTNGTVTINGEPIETPGSITNRYKNGTDSPNNGNTIKYGTSTTLPTGAAQGDIYLRYV